jgi:hypothetical protein
LESNGQGDQGTSIIEAENNIHETIYEYFVKSKYYFESGLVLGLYRILGVIAFLISLVACFTDNEEAKARANYDYIYDPTRAINMYSLVLPLVAFAYDH